MYPPPVVFRCRVQHQRQLNQVESRSKICADCDALWQALNDDRIDVLATDHAPHTLSEKQNPYTKALGPLVQYALPALLTKVKEGKITLAKMVEKPVIIPPCSLMLKKEVIYVKAILPIWCWWLCSALCSKKRFTYQCQWFHWRHHLFGKCTHHICEWKKSVCQR